MTTKVFGEIMVPIKKTVEEWLNSTSYAEDAKYVPSKFAFDFVNFIKCVNGTQGEENKTPVVHLRMLDTITNRGADTINLCHRGLAKTTVLGEYLFLYIAVFGSLPNFGSVPLAIYVSDSIENGVKNMRKNLEFRWENSDFLRQYIPNIKFTDIRWEFNNIDGTRFIVKGYGAKTGVRGAKEMGKRPVLAVLDDLISDEDARSETVISSVEDTVYKAVDYALHPTRKKIIWSGTPFNARDPLYKAVESGAWFVNVYPVCEFFPCTREEFKGSWEDRFTYEYVSAQYNKALLAGKVDAFNQEMMLRIMSEEDRLIKDHDIGWYKAAHYKGNLDAFNIYITTDFATSVDSAADFSVISVWAYTSDNEWLWLDGVCRVQDMNDNINDLFRFCGLYDPKEVGVEVSGQQGGFVTWIEREMGIRKHFFSLASDGNGNKAGIRPSTTKSKIDRFHIMVPMFRNAKIKFPVEMKNTPILAEMYNELSLVSAKGFKSKHDDFIDTISMLGSLTPYTPSPNHGYRQDEDSIWAEDNESEFSVLNSYVV
jgi:phage terminase large subunit-like protein